MDRSLEAVLDEFGKVADVIDVSVRHDHRLDLRGRDRKRNVVERRHVGFPLEHSAVHEKVMTVGLDQMLAAGDGARGADER